MRVTLGGRKNGEKRWEELVLIGMEKSVPDSESVSRFKPAILSRMARSTSGGFDVKRERTEFTAVGWREDKNRRWPEKIISEIPREASTMTKKAWTVSDTPNRWRRDPGLGWLVWGRSESLFLVRREHIIEDDGSSQDAVRSRTNERVPTSVIDTALKTRGETPPPHP